MIINIEKKHLFLISALIVFLAGIILVFGYGGSQPAVMGHTAGEIDWTEASLSSFYVGSCTTSPAADGECKCNLGEKIMLMTGNSAGPSGYCQVLNQGTTDVKGTCSLTIAGSKFACFK